jgi:hypothetical protein
VSLQPDPAKSVFADYVDLVIRQDARVVPQLIWHVALLEVRVPAAQVDAARSSLPIINERGAATGFVAYVTSTN